MIQAHIDSVLIVPSRQFTKHCKRVYPWELYTPRTIFSKHDSRPAVYAQHACIWLTYIQYSHLHAKSVATTQASWTFSTWLESCA